MNVHDMALDEGHIPVAEPPSAQVEDEDAVDEGGSGAQGHEGVHVGSAACEGPEARAVKFRVEGDDGQEQEQLGEGEGHHVLFTVEEVFEPLRHGQPEPVQQHVVHGDVHEGHEKVQGEKEAPLQAPLLVVAGGLAVPGGQARGPTCRVLRGGAVAESAHLLDDAVG